MLGQLKQESESQCLRLGRAVFLAWLQTTFIFVGDVKDPLVMLCHNLDLNKMNNVNASAHSSSQCISLIPYTVLHIITIITSMRGNSYQCFACSGQSIIT